jgi:hypothetical protein
MSFVHKSLAADAFVVGNQSDAIILDLSEKPEFKKQVAAGKCFRMPNLSLIRANFSLSKSLALPYQTFLG